MSIPQPPRPTLLLTRSEEDNAAWAADLAGRGYPSISLPCLSCQLLEDDATRGALSRALAGASWLALTSRRGAEATAALAGALPAQIRVASVGETTAAAARRLLRAPALTAAGGTAAALAEAIIRARDEGEPAGSVVLACADRARPELEERLRAAGIPVIRIPVYTTRPARAGEVALPSLEDADAALMASPSAVEGLIALLGAAPSLPAVTLGPTTTAAAQAAGMTVVGEARARGLDGLLAALPQPLPGRRHPETPTQART